MRRCTECVMPETWPGIAFNEEGVCSLCTESDKVQVIDWEKRQATLHTVLKYAREYAENTNNKYNCIVGYSGGKDTAYTLWAMIKKYEMKPLVITFDHGFKLSPEGEWNLREIPKMLDCDHLVFTIGNGLRNALCAKASKVMGDFCWHCHNGVGAFPARISRNFDIPLQMWGEPTALYQTQGAYKMGDLEEQDEEHFKKVFQVGITPEMILPEGYSEVDLQPMTWPEGKFRLVALYLGSFESWNQRKQVEIISKELGWKHRKRDYTYVDWDKIDCEYEAIREWQKYLKLGFGKVSFQASKDIREGLIDREEGLGLIEQYEGNKPSLLNDFLSDTGMTEEEFNTYTRRHHVTTE